MPARKVRLNRSPNSNQPARVTHTGAEVANRVALATLVYMIDQCQNARSPAKKNPPRASQVQSRRFSAASRPVAAVGARYNQANRNGRARNGR